MRGQLRAILVAALGASACSSGTKELNNPGSFVPREAGEKLYLPLSIPVAKLDLPVFLVGDDKIPSTGCLVSQPAPGPVPAADEIQQAFEKKSNYAAQVLATFEQYLVKANLDASLAHSLTESWKVSLDGPITVYPVDPANVNVNFTNENCTEKDLNWFKDNRPVGVTGIHAAKVKVVAESNLSSEASAKLGAAIEKINLEFKTSFSKSAASGGKFSLSASDVFVGVQATPLRSEECRAEIDMTPDTNYKICGDRYQVRLERSQVGKQFRFAITPDRGATSTFNETFGTQEPRKLGQSRMAYVNATDGPHPNVKMTVLFVAPTGNP